MFVGHQGRSWSSRCVADALPVHAEQRSHFLVLPRHRIGELLSGRKLISPHKSMQVIRNDAQLPPHFEAARLQLTSPMMQSRAEGLTLMKRRWDAERKNEHN